MEILDKFKRLFSYFFLLYKPYDLGWFLDLGIKGMSGTKSMLNKKKDYLNYLKLSSNMNFLKSTFARGKSCGFNNFS